MNTNTVNNDNNTNNKHRKSITYDTDVRDSLSFSDITIRKNLYKIKISSSVYRTLNYEMSMTYKQKSKGMNISITLLSSVAGGACILPFDLGIIAGVLSFSVSILSILKGFLQYDEKSQLHWLLYKDFRKLTSDIDEALSSNSIDHELYNRLENTYSDILEKTPIFDDDIVEAFKKENASFIEKAAKSGLVPDILTDFDSILNSDSFLIFNENKIIPKKFDKSYIETFIKKKNQNAKTWPRIDEIRKIKLIESRISDRDHNMILNRNENQNLLNSSNKIIDEINDTEYGSIII
jgi:hypothetical protein